MAVEVPLGDEVPEDVVGVVPGDEVAGQQDRLLVREKEPGVPLRVLAGVQEERH